MLKITAIVGSLRQGSVNAAVARATVELGAEQAQIELVSLADVPLYNGDVEAAGLPQSVQALHDSVGAADALLIFSPEYNGSFPAVTKNAIDWLSRPPRSWEGTALSMVVTTPGPRAGGSIRAHFDAIVQHQPIRPFPSLGIGSYGDKLTNGELTDPATRAELHEFLTQFAAFTPQR